MPFLNRPRKRSDSWPCGGVGTGGHAATRRRHARAVPIICMNRKMRKMMWEEAAGKIMRVKKARVRLATRAQRNAAPAFRGTASARPRGSRPAQPAAQHERNCK